MKRDDNVSFKGQVAQVLGVPKAIILKDIMYWVQHNANKNANFRDGHYWMWNTAKSFAKHFYFLKEKSIERWLKEMEGDKIIYRKKYNQNRGDHTYWYRCDEQFYEGVLSGEILILSDWTNPQNEERNGIPQNEDCRTSENEDSIPQNEDCRTSENEDSYTTTPSTLQLEPTKNNVEPSLDDVSPPQSDLFGQSLDVDEKKKVPAKKKSHIRPDDANEIMSFLNEMTGRSYAFGEAKGADNNLKKIYPIFKAGFGVEDIKNMIVLKCHEWLSDERNKRYLRPSTLFRDSNWPGYMDEAQQAVSDPKFAEMFKTAIDKSKPNEGYQPDQQSRDEWSDLKNAFSYGG